MLGLSDQHKAHFFGTEGKDKVGVQCFGHIFNVLTEVKRSITNYAR